MKPERSRRPLQAEELLAAARPLGREYRLEILRVTYEKLWRAIEVVKSFGLDVDSVDPRQFPRECRFGDTVLFCAPFTLDDRLIMLSGRKGRPLSASVCGHTIPGLPFKTFRTGDKKDLLTHEMSRVEALLDEIEVKARERVLDELKKLRHSKRSTTTGVRDLATSEEGSTAVQQRKRNRRVKGRT